jgi:hypothetical protein
MTQEEKLRELSAACCSLGAEVRYHPEHGHFTAMLWEEDEWNEAQARSIQQEIQQLTACYPGLVCYCFDAFSTLVYAVSVRQSDRKEGETT